MMRLFKIIFLLKLFFISTFVCAEEVLTPSRIVHDPFQRPVIKRKPLIDINVIKEEPDAVAKPLKLFSTLRSGKKSLANINGQILNLGDKIEGYKLIVVNERSVTLTANGKRSQISLDDTFEIQ